MHSQDRVFSDLNATTMIAGSTAYGLIEDAAIAVEDGRIAWVGPRVELPSKFAALPRTDFEGRLVTPALIDCHTHVVHGGHRAVEFEMRLNGASYEEVARAGGGIISTVKATRNASIDDLIAQALPRVDAMLAEGVSVIEVKSGYGLDRDTELNMLRAARALPDHRPVRVVTSFLGAHAVPEEYKDRPEAYIAEVCIPTLRAAHKEGLVDAVDAFCEGIAFLPDQLVPLFDVAKELGLPVKCHAEQLSNLGGAKLAASYDALSADHIEFLDEEGVRAMADAGTVGVILPGAFYTLRETQAPPIDLLRKHGVPMALATDCNPGSAPVTSLLLTMNMGCTLFRMTPEEALAGVTAHAARALGLQDCGRIVAGLRADLAVWNITHPAELAYRVGFNPLHTRILGGVI
ncbi:MULTISPECIES: imidazolonepropionase [unclassified Ruegeria]|uniref:imidazolonepropionase n=1 Tax=unclassified Ruegeria TaxID=2625375 RepID=UPI001488B8A2|nr:MULTISPECIES: imidazolonepropionase [unclassified Ruegeria]NOD64497.1 imidazolonepropionase [Ruegeria sp. HKCCD6109]NOD76781.1 imidazolonepropionase [Ruegeria sp. HKCCD4332]NOD88291.1 imidazolonepropionase [Ruegeria sp. HKCCD4318]NOE13200.1 imidazolonepropionase [Ruegeria sp. HKCCD4318-2]NOG11258.1 imidazolonepropionase [Ruegeria sp. HKCCD4315]